MPFMDDVKPQPLDPSVLGTKEHWDETYRSELSNHAQNPDDEGVIWFEDSGAEEKMIEYLSELPVFQTEEESSRHRPKPRILDLGTGNGHLLFALQEDGIHAEMLGIDYSPDSISLARQIQQTRKVAQLGDQSYDSNDPELLSFEVWDLLKSAEPPWLGKGFDVVLDKGTFDAISLTDMKDADGKTGSEIYSGRVLRLLKNDGYLLVTSCNWTSEELVRWIEGPGLVVHEIIDYPSFTFGGVKGQSVSTVCFRRAAVG